MKKLLTLLLTLLMMFTLVGCNSKQEEKPAIDEPQIEEPIVGGYIEVEDKNLTPELIEMFEKAFEGFDGANYTPVMLEATQVVAGTNYKFKADGTKTTNPMIQGTYYVYINKDLQGNISLLDIEVIEEHELKIFEPEEEIDTKIKQDVTNMSFWVVFYDQYGNELQREALKYGTVPSYKGILPKGFIGWDKSLKAITGNTYIHAICHEVIHEDNNQTQSEETDTKCLKNLDKVLKVIAGGILVHALYHEISRELCKPTITMYNVTAKVHGSHGKATVKVGSGKPTTETTQAAKGTSLVFTATPEEGYEFDHWEVVSGGIDIEDSKTNNPLNINMPDNALTIKAHLKATMPSTYNIIVEDDGHGTAKAQVGGADVTSAAPNATVTLVPTPKDGYAFKEWQIVRGLGASDITDNSFTMPSNEVKVKALFEKEYTVEVEASGHGSVSADVTKGVSGAEINLTITPDEGYEVDQIIVVRGGITVTGNKFNIGTADVKIKVTFKAVVPSTYTIIVEDDGHGTASADPTSATPGATVNLTATPKDGYAFKEWEIARGLESITGNSFTMPSNEVKVKAIFERVYNITLQTNEHGTVTATVGGETATTATENAEVTLTATPDEGYQLKEWKTVSGEVTVKENKFTMPASNVTVQAMFGKITVADILPNSFPDNYTDGWRGQAENTCSLYVNQDKLVAQYLYEDEKGPALINLDIDSELTPESNNYSYTNDDGIKWTFNMSGDVLRNVTISGASGKDNVLNDTYSEPECIAAGTMISMPGGKQKKVEELEIGDVICTFDHETGEVSSAPVCFIWESKNVGNAFTLTFENDVEVTVIEEHGFYDKEEQKYVFINLQNSQEYIGDHFYNADSNSWLELKNCEALNNSVDAYAIITSGHLNHMSNGMLSMCDGSVKVLANIFEYDEQMKFDEDKKKADIDAYGLTSKEKILELKGFTETDYDIYNLQYVDVMIGKGIITWEWMEALSDYCVANGIIYSHITNTALEVQ